MSPIVNDLWILTENGIVVFSRVYEKKVNPQLFGALMSALNTFSENLSDGGITNFELGEIRFVIVKRGEFIFVGSSLNKTKEKKVIDKLTQIANKFFEIYPETLEDWDYDISVFSDFGYHLE